MQKELLEELLNEDESATLDFKRDQYPFVGATDEQKGELLKDILAFANAWKRADSYILIGVDEVKGGRCKVVGVGQHLDDASLQQFVNSKTQRPVIFSYEAFSFEGVQVGAIRIPIQDRPLYLKQDYGKLKKHIVYVRRGSSTDIADPDEVSKMGAVSSKEALAPTLEVSFADVKRRKDLGHQVSLSSEIVEYEESQIPLIAVGPWSAASITTNKNYKREKAKYIASVSMLRPVGFLIKNVGPTLAANVRIEITGKITPEIEIIDEYEYPQPPKYDSLLSVNVPRIVRSKITVDRHEDWWTLTAQLGSVQPKALTWSRDVFYIGARQTHAVDFEGQIFADNLPEPLPLRLSVQINTKNRKLDLREVERGV